MPKFLPKGFAPNLEIISLKTFSFFAPTLLFHLLNKFLIPQWAQLYYFNLKIGSQTLPSRVLVPLIHNLVIEDQKCAEKL